MKLATLSCKYDDIFETYMDQYMYYLFMMEVEEDGVISLDQLDKIYWDTEIMYLDLYDLAHRTVELK